MSISDNATVIGLTGPFGSGCTKTAEILCTKLNYHSFALSTIIRERWKEKHSPKTPVRADPQAFGNQLRKEARNPGEIARLAIKHLEDLKEKLDRIVLDGIRNVGEVETLRQRFGRNFYLISLECPPSERLERLRSVYGNTDESVEKFREDNERDRDQEDPYGQQVELCVDAADVLIINDEEVTLKKLREKIINYVKVVTGETPHYPRPDEILMNLAYSAAHGSKCLKRQVGAVIVTAEPLKIGDIVGQGFNENPNPTLSCVDEPEYGADPKKGIPGRCYRDIVRHQGFISLAKQKVCCPKCSTPISMPEQEEPPWRCKTCDVNLEIYFWPERAMTLCTTVHAEVAAVLAAGIRAKGATLYTTTYPCFQCTEKIVQAGIRHVVFTEPYPDIRAAERFQIANIETIRFEGVRSGRFDEIFSRSRPYITKQRAAIKLSS